ncbi:tfiid associated protein [Ophiostoma piceae UAMH 11346]|uniref:Tfiid associated protein n=1 Tax=Ophiostoma piceae (strain UAMH 11346) TaxID=1262450 RepID=S3BSG4_OPHP1|nr:tfiid associated protein [Ophiostoma piceae UAMH 11346]
MSDAAAHDAVANGVPAKPSSEQPETESTAGPAKPFSWLDPHPTFVIVFVGKDERPFGLQKDFLCAKSTYFRDHFNKANTSKLDDNNKATARPSPAKDDAAGTENASAVRTEPAAGQSSDNKAENVENVENVVYLADISSEAFAYAQNYLYTGLVVPEIDGNLGTDVTDDRTTIPSYDVLVGIWKLGHQLGIEGLCDRTLEVMSENKRLSQTIPATGTLVQVWKDTPEGSSIRQLLLSWAAEYLRSSEARRSEFAKSLPQELLSELVVAMSSSYGDFWAMPATFSGGPGNGVNTENGYGHVRTLDGAAEDTTMHDANGHSASYNTPISIGNSSAPSAKRARYFESYPAANVDGNGLGSSGGAGISGIKSTRGASTSTGATIPNNINGGRKGGGRASMPGPRAFSASGVPTPAAVAAVAAAAALSASPSAGAISLSSATGTTSAPGSTVKKRGHLQMLDMDAFSAKQKLRFCDDLLTRMLSGPGFWTRLVGPFREPVNPSSDGIPDYFDKVKRPMDLGTIKANLDNRQYKAPEEFLADMRQIFSNAYTYWKKGDTIWQVCERLEKTFEEKYAQMNKWLAKLDGEEIN